MWLEDVAKFRPPPPHFLVAVSTPAWCVLVGLCACVMVCTCWLVCHGVYLLACVSWSVLMIVCYGAATATAS